MAEPDEEHEGTGRAFLRNRVRNEIWKRLTPGEVLLEFSYAHFNMPGGIALTDRRLLFLGRGFLSRSRAWLSIPRSAITSHEVKRGLGGIELRISTDERQLTFIDLERQSADYISRALNEPSAPRHDLEYESVVEARRLLPRWGVLCVALIGIGISFKWLLIGAVVIFAALTVHFVDVERSRRLDR